MEKLHGTWKNIWVDYKSLHARGRPQVLCICLLSGGLEQMQHPLHALKWAKGQFELPNLCLLCTSSKRQGG